MQFFFFFVNRYNLSQSEYVFGALNKDLMKKRSEIVQKQAEDALGRRIKLLNNIL